MELEFLCKPLNPPKVFALNAMQAKNATDNVGLAVVNHPCN